MPTSTVNKETARTLQDFKELVVQQRFNQDYRHFYLVAGFPDIIKVNDEAAELYAKSVASLAWDAGIEKAIKKFEEAKTKAQTLPELVYLDATLAILDTIKTDPDKETFITNLFSE